MAKERWDKWEILEKLRKPPTQEELDDTRETFERERNRVEEYQREHPKDWEEYQMLYRQLVYEHRRELEETFRSHPAHPIVSSFNNAERIYLRLQEQAVEHKGTH
ncbi:MAG: hypothetical protein Q7S76_03915 [bacterium]|nr:hypothetical protein [bacterium]